MNRLVWVVSALLTSGLYGWTQGVEPLDPSAVNPKPVQPRRSKNVDRPKVVRSPEGDKPLIASNPTLAIKGVIIVKSMAEIQENGVPNATGIVVKDIPFLAGWAAHPEPPFLGRTLTENAIRDIQESIILYCREHGKLLVDVILPEQNIESGVLQLWFLEGKVEKLTVKNEGKKWFKDKFILSQVRLHPGDGLDSNQLNQDLNWLNNNPFRRVDVNFKPGGKLGLTEVDLEVQDRFPVRPYLGYENSGTRFTHPDRLLAGLNWGNAFGLDHQFNYQYSTDLEFDLVKAHSASYIAPLPWRHSLMVYGSYVDARAEFPGGTTADGHSWQTSARYSVPLPEIAKYRHEVSVGFDFKRSDNNLLSGGTTVLQDSETDVAQFVVGYSGALPDPYGRSSFGLEFNYSPGGLTSNNKSAEFENLRKGTKADYFYARLNVTRLTRLPWDFSWVLNGWAQLATERLLPSEELALGGYNTIRGYDERVLTGDEGWILSNEIRSPALPLGNITGIRDAKDELQVLGFFDCGGARVIDPTGADGANPNKTLASVGAGMRYTVGRNLSFRLDYGFPLMEKSINERSSRVHLGALLSF
ncbi:MAG TPA: ShlB/FhaC/HecB family hemolysin secretion/activation protein [Candidatus Saccharimonadales bacterium]|nr:ShlB/FhaC/HecB family hemolysin secretion/activation protein [Candidatus Saccharimonadales bacterium]